LAARHDSEANVPRTAAASQANAIPTGITADTRQAQINEEGEAEATAELTEGAHYGNKIKSIAPVVIPSGGTQLSAETVVFGLDKDGGLWKWDTGQKTDTWTQVCRPLKG
jgi:hypothetical protein